MSTRWRVLSADRQLAGEYHFTPSYPAVTRSTPLLGPRAGMNKQGAFDDVLLITTIVNKKSVV